MRSPEVARHPSLSIIVPVYNEDENLKPLIEAIFAELSRDHDFLELILVDDGSHDRTVSLALRLADQEPRIRLLSHARNRGLGAAIKTGLEAAGGDLVLYTDADLPFDFRAIPALLRLADNNNLIIGCRANRGEGPLRWILSKGYNLLCRFALGLHVRDVNFACKLIPRRVLRGMKLHSEGSFIDAEILLECRRQGVEITEYALTYYPRTRGQSTLSRPRVIVGIVAEMLSYLTGPTHFEYHELVQAERSPIRRYAVALSAVGLMLLANLLLQPSAGPIFFLTFIPCVLIVARYGGVGPGLLASVFATISTEYFLLPPIHSLAVAALDDILGLSMFAFLALMISVVAGSRRCARFALEKASQFVESVGRAYE